MGIDDGCVTSMNHGIESRLEGIYGLRWWDWDPLDIPRLVVVDRLSAEEVGGRKGGTICFCDDRECEFDEVKK